MKPSWSERNFTPRLTDPVSLSLGTAGVADAAQIVQGQVLVPTVTVLPAPGTSMLPLSSAARLLMVTEPVTAGVQA